MSRPGFKASTMELPVSLCLIAFEQSSPQRDVQGFRKRDAGSLYGQ